jgi:predicted metal-dependent hydrolase
MTTERHVEPAGEHRTDQAAEHHAEPVAEHLTGPAATAALCPATPVAARIATAAPRPTTYTVTLSDLVVDVTHKPVKHLHIGVYPPDGAIRASAPLTMTPAAVHAALVGRLPWMRRQRATFAAQPRETPREMVSGESHWVFGQRLRLRVELTTGPTRITLQGKRTLLMYIAPDRPPAARLEAMHGWYRSQLRGVLTPLIATWSARLGVAPAGWRIQRMKTRWGSCSPRTHRLLFNLELAKHSPACIEYIVVHELAHLLVHNHGDAFVALLDEHLPNWRVLRKELGEGVLGV